MTPLYYEEIKSVLPVVFLKDTTVFPGQVTHFDTDGDYAEKALEQAESSNGELLLIPQFDPTVQEPELGDLFHMGTIVVIRQSFRMPNGRSKVLAEGIRRAKPTLLIRRRPYCEAEVIAYEYKPELVEIGEREKMLMRLTGTAAVRFLKDEGKIPDVFLYPLLDINDPGKLSDEILPHLDLRPDESDRMLAELDVFERLILVQQQVNLLSGLAALEQQLNDRVTERMNQSQKEYMLREQLQMIRDELGEDPSDPETIEEEYRERINALDMPKESKEAVLKEVDRLTYMPPSSPELNVSRTYLDTILDLPWGKVTEDNLDLQLSRRVLDAHHYGLKDVKERILEFIAVRQLRQDSKGSILCLVGPPGVGKTSIARSIAEALGREFTSMRLGGMTDESEIRGHRKTYIGSMPGRIISQMTKCKSMNPLFLFDEIDKVGSDYRGDPASALLEVLDPEQNFEFTDRYLEIPFDLSRVMFITTANTTDTIPSPLLDRMEVIRISGYTEEEKYRIASKFLFPKQRSEAGLTSRQITMTPNVFRAIISNYTREAGVRELERMIGKICRRAAKQIVEGKKVVRVRNDNITEFLGEPKYRDDELSNKPQVGVVNGLAWTEVGGELLHIEANVMRGHGAVQLTGSLGDVMKESAMAAISYIRSCAKRYGIDEDFHAVSDIHIHMPEGAVPKDGPSAGVSMATAVVSALTHRPVRNDLAMTGEITLTGRVLAIGGVKEKVLAARRYHIPTVLLPRENLRDLKEIEPEILEGMNIVPLDTIDDVLRMSLLDPVEEKGPVVFRGPEVSSELGFRAAKKEVPDDTEPA